MRMGSLDFDRLHSTFTMKKETVKFKINELNRELFHTAINPRKVFKALYFGSPTGPFQPMHLSQLPREHYSGAAITDGASL